ncbi:MAG TPA: hypothetical protein VE288_05060 [Rubrobacteraceae bacterium]|nr:hypothetical protein [Rubrobacteraceae bacterium]
MLKATKRRCIRLRVAEAAVDERIAADFNRFFAVSWLPVSAADECRVLVRAVFPGLWGRQVRPQTDLLGVGKVGWIRLSRRRRRTKPS